MIDIKHYIESGIIEEYTLGRISEQEKSEVECLVKTYPEIAAELKSAAESLLIFAELGSVAPDIKMRERIWNQIQLIDTTETSEEQPTAVIKTINTTSTSTRINYLVAATLAIVAAGALIWGVTTNTKLSEAENQIIALNNANENITKDFSELRNIVQENNNIYQRPNSQVIKLSGIESKSPNSMAYAIWDKNTNEVFLDIKNLPQNPQGKQYQLWTINEEGTPISVGVFDQSNQMQILKLGEAKSSTMFAVTLEQEGGVESPTLTEMFIAGKVSA